VLPIGILLVFDLAYLVVVQYHSENLEVMSRN